MIPHEMIRENPFSSVASGSKGRNASPKRIPTENAIKHTSTFFNFAMGYPITIIPITEIILTTSTAMIQ